MSRRKLRNSIALEAARLMLRGKETDYVAARKRAARWLSRRKLDASDMPTAAEIQAELCALAGLFTEEHQAAASAAMRAAALELMTVLQEFEPHLSGSAIEGTIRNGASIALDVQAETIGVVAEVLNAAGFRTRSSTIEGNSQSGGEKLTLNHGFPCEIVIAGDDRCQPESHSARDGNGRCGLQEMQQLVEQSARDAEFGEPPISLSERAGAPNHPDVIASFEILLARLELVQFDSESHPEGDALYHSLQVFELGMEQRPYDEEFLLACLLHDAGLAVDRRDPVDSLLRMLSGLVTDRTQFLIENLKVGAEYLRSGQIPRSVRKSEDFDDLILLACCDRDGRVRGAQVRELDEALAYIAGLETAWDDPEAETD